MSGCIQAAAADINNETIVFLRNAIALLILTPLVWQQSRRHVDPKPTNTQRYSLLATRRIGMHLLRGVFGLAAMYAFFYTIPRLSLPEAVLLTYSAPLFLPFIGALWLQEKLSLWTILAACIGFVGIIIIQQPDAHRLGDAWQDATLIGVLAGFLAACAMATIRKMSNTEPTFRIVFWFALFSTLVSSIPMIWNWQTPQPDTILILIGVGIFATAGQLLITRGYQLAPASKVGVFTYTVVVFATLYAVIAGQNLPGWHFWLGCCLVTFAGGLIMATRQTSKNH